MQHPLDKLTDWWQQALTNSPLQQKSAVCISTVDPQGFPAARFVDLKSVNKDGVTFCSYLDSAKGHHLQHNPKISMTIWWDHVGYQIRVLGLAEPISAQVADDFWQTRSRSAQITTTTFMQSAPLANEDELMNRFEQTSMSYADKPIPRPQNWGGYVIKPISIEFLTFKQNRLHLRELFELRSGNWQASLLQP